MLIAAVERLAQLVERGLHLELSPIVLRHFPAQFSGVARGARARSQLVLGRGVRRSSAAEGALARVPPRFLDVVAAVTHCAANRQDSSAQQD